MKYIFTLTLSLMLCGYTFAQTDFMPVGATLSGRGFARGFIGNVVFTSEKDTFCDGAPCRKVNVAYNNARFPSRSYSEVQFFQQRGDSIFEYSDWYKKSWFAFKNNYAVGDSVVLDPRSEYYSVMYIDSVIVSNGVKRFRARRKCVEISNLGTSIRFGSFNLYDKFYPDFTPYSFSCYWGDMIYYTPLCYSDSVTSYYTKYYTGRCDSIQTITGAIEVSDNLVLSPNPATTFVNIESPQTQSVLVKIQNINGVVVHQKTGFTPTSVDVQNLPNGLYILSIQADKIPPTIQKLVVHH